MHSVCAEGAKTSIIVGAWEEARGRRDGKELFHIGAGRNNLYPEPRIFSPAPRAGPRKVSSCSCKSGLLGICHREKVHISARCWQRHSALRFYEIPPRHPLRRISFAPFVLLVIRHVRDILTGTLDASLNVAPLPFRRLATPHRPAPLGPRQLWRLSSTTPRSRLRSCGSRCLSTSTPMSGLSLFFGQSSSDIISRPTSTRNTSALRNGPSYLSDPSSPSRP